MTTLTANQLTLSYNGKPIVSDLAFSVSDGELVGLLGPNGAGKTTVLRALAGLMRPRGGVALLNGQNVASIPAAARARDIGMIPQSEHHVWPLTIEEAVTLGRAPHRGWFLPMGADDRQIVNHVLQVTGLLHLRQRPVDKLSGGERQRMIIARALAQEPRVMLLDEPTSNLDVHHQFQVLDLIRKLVNEQGLTAIIAIHDLALAARYCDRLVLIHEGRGFANGKPEDVLTPSNLMHVFGIEAELYRDPHGRLALCIH